jgi:hypothetical protein
MQNHNLYKNNWHTKVSDLTPAQRKSLAAWRRELWDTKPAPLDEQDMSTPVGLVMSHEKHKAYSEV